MAKKRRVEITVDTERTVVLTSGLAREPLWCPRCGQPVQIPTDEQTGRSAGRERDVAEQKGVASLLQPMQRGGNRGKD